MSKGSSTVVSIVGDDFHINGEPTCAGREYRGMRIEGLLMNARFVQATFDDLNPETRARWDYPDGRAWDAEANTRAFVAMMPQWRQAGLLSFTFNLQGGSPTGYSKVQPWHNSAFTETGDLREAYMRRVAMVLDEADRLGMAPILGLFYFGQDQRLQDEAAVIRGVENVVDWLIARGDRHVLIEIANEANINYDHPIILADRVHELVERVRQRSAGKLDTPAGRLLAGASMSGGAIPPDTLIAASDFLLLHGNGVSEPDRIREMVDECRARPTCRGQPVVFNEDDHEGFDEPDSNMLAAVSRHASWGHFDYRREGEPFEAGYQSVPTDWTTSHPRKQGFFRLLNEITSGG